MKESQIEIINLIKSALLKSKALKITYQELYNKANADYNKIINNPITKYKYADINTKLYNKREIGSKVNNLKHIISNLENIIIRINEL